MKLRDQSMVEGAYSTSVSHNPQEALRMAVTRAIQILSSERVIRYVRMYHNNSKLFRGNGKDVSFTSKALLAFSSGETQTLRREHFDYLEAPLMRSPFGHALRHLDVKSLSKIDNMIEKLVSGQILVNSQTEYRGRYFMYYGSYVKEDRYAIRVIDITDGDGYILAVTDHIKDVLKDKGNIRVSYGVLTAFEARPQFILMPQEHNETKVGLTFMVANRPFIDGHGNVERLNGRFLTMTVDGHIAYRRWMMRREVHLEINQMIEESGAFTNDQIKKNKIHVEAFDDLKELMDESDEDPMVNYRTGA